MAIQPVTLDKISPVTSAPAATNASANGNTKNIQTQITSKQQHLKQISSDNTITATEKEEKRRELQKEIDELNRELEQKKQEQREKAEEAAKKQAQADALKKEMLKKSLPTSKSSEDLSQISSKEIEAGKSTEARHNAEKADALKDAQKKADMSVKEIQQLLSADYLIQKERVQEQVDMKTESTINVLESEIKQDKAYGTDTSKKEAELDALRNKENFWSDALKTQESQKKTTEQAHPTQRAINADAKIVIDQI